MPEPSGSMRSKIATSKAVRRPRAVSRGHLDPLAFEPIRDETKYCLVVFDDQQTHTSLFRTADPAFRRSEHRDEPRFSGTPCQHSEVETVLETKSRLGAFSTTS